nr:MAG TPA: hypothetical protein [Bacteriophage sp.]
MSSNELAFDDINKRRTVQNIKPPFVQTAEVAQNARFNLTY